MNYQLTLTEADRQELARAFGKFVTALTNAAPIIDEKSGTDHAKALLSPPALSPAAAPASPPIEARDRWARDRKGKPLPNPEGAEAVDVNLWKTEQKPKYLKVTWQNAGQGFGDANCFDAELWPWLIKQAGKKTRLYLVHKGEYRNVVGVRA